MRRAAALITALASLFGAAIAQDAAPDRRTLSLAAGYKAQFLCSGIFNGGKSGAQIAADELTNIYPELEPVLPSLPKASINRRAKTVSVRFADDMPPRIAAWRPFLGCSSLPTGADASFVENLPRADVDASAAPKANAPWPDGDALPKGALKHENAALTDAIDNAFAGEFGGVTSAVVIVKNGALIDERYLDGYTIHTSQRTWSVAKSIAATIIGAAVHEGLLDVTAPTGIPEWSREGDPRQAITLENLLRMASGLGGRSAGNRTDDVYFGGGLVTEHAVANRLEATPGARWRYANNDTMLAMRTLRAAMDDDATYLSFPFEKVLLPIGMTHTALETDWDGNFILSSQVWTTARDLARLGILYLNDGVWNGRRILPEGWSEYVATPAPAQPPRAETRPSHGYGAQFWLYQGYPGVPEGTYAALGNRGQFIIIVPAEGVVIVRRGYDYSGERFDGPAFAAAVLAALAG